MIIVREYDTSLRYSFYIKDDRGTIGVWADQAGRVQYYHYLDTFIIRMDGCRAISSELEVLVCFGQSAAEVYEKAINARQGIVMEMK